MNPFIIAALICNGISAILSFIMAGEYWECCRKRSIRYYVIGFICIGLGLLLVL